MMRSLTEQSPSSIVVEESGVDKDKEKKKTKRRSSRRSKHNNNNNINSSNSVNEIRGEEISQSLGNRTKSNYTCSEAQTDFDYDYCHDAASYVAFNSMPNIHINEQVQSLLPPSDGVKVVSNSCPVPVGCGNFQFDGDTNTNINVNGRGKIFASHWSLDAVNEALQKGDAFKASFHVNSHNRLEAYCRIGGVSTDVLVNGIAAQNRAVEGDIVVIKVDPLACWTKMKGSNEPSLNTSLTEDCNLTIESSEMANSFKGKSQVDVYHGYTESGSSSVLQKGIYHEDISCSAEAVHQELSSHIDYKFTNGHHQSTSNSSHFGFSRGQNEAVNGVDRLCTLLSLHPSKRPTGRVLAIIERSSRRDAIVGFLNVKQWLYYREGFKKDVKKNKNSLPISAREYLQLTPTDPKFPKMMVLVITLPDFIKKRLEVGDATVEMELVAAQINNWDEESLFPQVHVSHIFGRGSEMETRISAILYENAICCSDFSPESLACIPCIPWEVPEEELRKRKDLRNFCIFTIDPSTATELDDALSVERLPNGTHRVGVHIADASYFVLPYTALDVEVQSRSTSVYMLRQKLPMLPPLLSENLGSLNPGVDRLAFSIFWELNGAGDIIDRWIGRTVIKSCCKLSYEHAQDMVDGVITEEACNTSGKNLPELHGHFEWPEVIRSVKTLHEISKTLKEKRFSDGALRLESSKICFLFDECGIPYDSILCEQKDSNFLVEEFMLLANRTAAEVISRAYPDSALLRRHPEPNMRKLKEFEAFCSKHGLDLDTSSSGHFHRSLERIRGKLKDDHVLIGILMSYASRPMQLATYFCSGLLKDNTNWGHYALAVPLYTHFTSPLRRYPDIVVHRTLAAAIEAEELYMGITRIPPNVRMGEEVTRCFTGVNFNKDAAESVEGRQALSAAASKYKIPCTESLADVVEYCNERKLASRHVKDACDKLYMWVLLKKKEVILSDARVLSLGPRFMSIYIQKLAIERRIYYEEIEGLTVEWLETTSTLVLNLCPYKRAFKRSGSGFYRELSEFAWVVSPCSLEVKPWFDEESGEKCGGSHLDNNGKASQHAYPISESEVDPVVFPITVRHLSTIPVALHAIGGDDGPIDIGVRVFVSSYFG